MDLLPSSHPCSLSLQCMHVVHFTFTISTLCELEIIVLVRADSLQIHSLNTLCRLFILHVIKFDLVFLLWPVQAFSGTQEYRQLTG